MNIENRGQGGAPARVPPFSRSEFERRIKGAQDGMAARGLDFLVVSAPEDVYYLTGFQTVGYVITPQWLVMGADLEPTLVVRAGERSNAEGHSWVQKIVPYGEGAGAVGATRDLIAGGGTVGLDINSRFITLATARALEAMAGERAKDASGVVLTLRRIKSGEEIKQVEKAARTSDAAMNGALATVGRDVSDREIAVAMDAGAIMAGSAYLSLPMAVSAGSETAYMHNTWSGNVLGEGDVVMLEGSGVVGRYIAPVARTAVVGKAPPYLAERTNLMFDSIASGIDSMRPGATCGEAYEAFARPVTAAGFPAPVRTGYSVGLAFPPTWTEDERLDLLPGNPTVLEPGMVFHTPRSIRLPGEQTTIVSETVVITDGAPRVLSALPRKVFHV